MKLSISMPTRGRPERLLDTLTRTLPLLSEPDTLVVVGVDADDEATLGIAGQLKELDLRVQVDVREREDSIGAKWDRVLDYPADVYFPIADYTAHQTQGFDSRILEAASLFPDGIGCVYTHWANWSFPRSQAPTDGLVRRLGFMYCPYFPYWFVDHWLHDIVMMIDRVSYVDIEIDAGIKLPTQELRELSWWADFFDSQTLYRRRQALDLISDLDQPEWQKEILRRNFPLVEIKSKWINDHCRSMQCPAMPPGGDRYDRIKAQAQKMKEAELPLLRRALEELKAA